MIKILKCLITFCLLFAMAACQPPAEPEKPKGVLRIATVPTDMPIIVNGQPKGNSPAGDGQYFSISLEEGEHKIEILKVVNEEKEQYAQKTLFLAADTIPVVTLEAKERLTSFGKEVKAQRDKELAEKERIAEIERKRQEAIEVEKRKKRAEIQQKFERKNKKHTDYLNSAKATSGGDFKDEFTYLAKGCIVTVKTYGLHDGETVRSTVNVKNLNLEKSTTGISTKQWYASWNDKVKYYAGTRFVFSCKNSNKCVDYKWEGDTSKENEISYVTVRNTQLSTAESIVNAMKNMIINCQ